MAARLPVLASDVCGYADHIAKANAGQLVPSPFDQGTLNRMLAEMLRDATQRDRWGANGWHYVTQNDVFSMPEKVADAVESLLDLSDMVLVMTVDPGFGGQSFIPASLDKLRACRKIIDDSGLDIRLEIDGGVKAENIREIAAAGTDTFVAGSAIFGAAQDSDPNRYDTVVGAMRAELAKAV